MKHIVMVIEDHASIRRMLRQAFDAEHFEVAEATNGAEGVQKAPEIKPSIIILDLSMPVMNGLEAAAQLRTLMPNVPLLMFTNNAAGIIDREARSAGISAVISKSESDALRQLIGHVKILLGSDGIQRAS